MDRVWVLSLLADYEDSHPWSGVVGVYASKESAEVAMELDRKDRVDELLEYETEEDAIDYVDSTYEWTIDDVTVRL